MPALRRAMASQPLLVLSFKPNTLVWMLERAVRDEAFAARRSKWMVKLIRGLVTAQLHKLAVWVPASLQPLMDVTLIKRA